MMQNHLEILSKYNFWIRNVRNWSKSLTESLRNFQDLSRRTHKGPYGPQPGPGPNPDKNVSGTEKLFFELISETEFLHGGWVELINSEKYTIFKYSKRARTG